MEKNAKKRKSGAERKAAVIPGTATGSKTVKSAGSAQDTAAVIRLNPDTARQAVIFSEIIGKPLSKRRRFR